MMYAKQMAYITQYIHTSTDMKTYQQLRSEALALFNDAFGLEYTKAEDVREYLCYRVFSFNTVAAMQLKVPGNSKAFWESVALWTHKHLETKAAETVQQQAQTEFEEYIEELVTEYCEPDSDSDEQSTTERTDDETSSPISFTHIRVDSINEQGTIADINIGHETRRLQIKSTDIPGEFVTVRSEVSVELERNDGTLTVSTCKLEIYKDSEVGIYRAFPLCRHGGKVEWLYPDAQTRYKKVAAILHHGSADFRYIEVDQGCQTTAMVRSDYPVLCRIVETEQGSLYHPSCGWFERVGGKWISVNESPNVKWLSAVQMQNAYKYRVGAQRVYSIQQELGSNESSLWSISKIEYNKFLMVAHCTCVKGNIHWNVGDENIFPCLHLIPSAIPYTQEELECYASPEIGV